MAKSDQEIVYLEANTGDELRAMLMEWQENSGKRLQSISTYFADGVHYCFAVTNPMEVLLVDHSGNAARLTDRGALYVFDVAG